MDGGRFDTLAKALAAPSRRGLLRAWAALPALVGTGRAEAGPGCVPNGARCDAGSACCSGRCEKRGRPGPRVCRRTPDQGVCTTERNTCAPGSDTGDACVAVEAGAEFRALGGERYGIDPACPEHYRRLLQDILRRIGRIGRIVHCFSCDPPAAPIASDTTRPSHIPV